MVTGSQNHDIDDDTLLNELPEGWPDIECLMDDCPEGENLEVRSCQAI